MAIKLPDVPEGKNVYFASDFHLGAPDMATSRERERFVVQWLDEILPTTHALFLVGDIFDFWYEYKHVAPKGYIRLLGKLAAFQDAGIPIHVFTGNHDMWMFDYLEDEIGIQLHREPVDFTLNGIQFFIGHGDGLGPGDRFYKFIKGIFRNPACQWLFGRIHPNTGMWIANTWSRKSRKKNAAEDAKFYGEQEHLYQFCQNHPEKEKIDYFVFGHRHQPIHIALSSKSTYVNLGEWIHFRTYGIFDGKELQLHAFEKNLVVHTSV